MRISVLELLANSSIPVTQDAGFAPLNTALGRKKTQEGYKMLSKGKEGEDKQQSKEYV